MTTQFSVTLLIVMIIVPLYYSVVDSRITALSKPLLLVMWMPRAYSYREGRSLWRLGLASSAQLVFLSCLVVLTGVGASHAFQAPLRSIHLIYGVLLGIGEMGLSSFLCHVVVKAIMTLAPSWGPNSMQEWITIARGGWMREYLNALDKDADNVLCTTSWSGDVDIPGLKDLAKKYNDRFKEHMDSTSAGGFTAFSVLWDSLERAGAADRKKLRDAIAATSLKTGEKMYMQLRGAKFQPSGENSIAGGLVFTIKSKEWATVAPKEYAKTTAMWPKPKWGA